MPFIATHNTGDYLTRPYRNPANFLMAIVKGVPLIGLITSGKCNSRREYENLNEVMYTALLTKGHKRK